MMVVGQLQYMFNENIHLYISYITLMVSAGVCLQHA